MCRNFLLLPFLFIGLLCLSSVSFASPEDEIVLPDVELEGGNSTSGNDEDPSLIQGGEAGREGANSSDSSRSLGHGLGMKSNVRVLESTASGQPVSILGTRRSAEEVDVQALGGVSISPPQGGGFDFSQYPLLLWDRAQFEESFNEEFQRDLKSFSASAKLTSWAEDIVSLTSNREEAAQTFSAHRVGGNSTTGGQYDAVLGVGKPGNWAGQVAWGVGSNQGVGTLWNGRIHSGLDQVRDVEWKVLAAEVRGEDPGSRSFPTPLTTRETRSIAPVLEFTLPQVFSTRVRLHSVWNQIDFNSPEYGSFSQDQALQVGADARFRLSGHWEGTLTGRRSQLRQTSLDLQSPVETILGFSVAYFTSLDHSESSSVRVDAQGSSLLGWFPSLQFAVPLSRSNHPWGRLSWEGGIQSRFPSLLDRYYSLPGLYSGNAELIPERGYRTSLQWVGDKQSVNWIAQAFGEFRESAIVRNGFAAPVNQGSAHLYGLELNGGYSPQGLRSLSIQAGVRAARSVLGVTQTSFPYFPSLQGNGALSFKGEGGRAFPKWGSSIQCTAQSERSYGEGQTLNPFALWDAEFWVQWPRFARRGSGLEAALRVENLANRREVELIADYPLPGRTASLWLRGALDF